MDIFTLTTVDLNLVQMDIMEILLVIPENLDTTHESNVGDLLNLSVQIVIKHYTSTWQMVQPETK